MIIPLDSYQTNKYMDAPTRKKPIHERAFSRHHAGVFLRLLFNFLLLSELRPILAWNLSLKSFAMGGGIELCGLLENPGLRGTGGGMSTDRHCTTGYLRRFHIFSHLSVWKYVPSG